MRTEQQQQNEFNNVTDKVDITRNKNYMNVHLNTKEGNSFVIFSSGPDEEELSRLKLEERKRQHSEAHEFSD